MARSRRFYKKKPNTAPNSGDDRGKPIVKSNAAFEKFYRTIIPAEEWDSFMATLRKPLPVSFRFSGPAGDADCESVARAAHFMREFCDRLADLPAEFDNPQTGAKEPVVPPAPLPWYPRGLAFQFQVPRFVLRKSPEFKELHKYIVTEHEAGTINRQEAVSMVPPLFLDVAPDHAVLDICAAPGSKTQQLVDALHTGVPSGHQPTGFVVANDLERRRCQLLARNLQTLSSPAYAVTNCDATAFPVCYGPDGRPMAFDRILADVVCSGDGTIRKSPDLWRRYTSADALGSHAIQLRIAQRAAALLKVGGQMVYSTCSMNPVENEAVLTALLRWGRGSIELVDVSDRMPELRRRPGLHSWQVYDTKRDALYDSYSDVAEAVRANEAGTEQRPSPGPIRSTMFVNVPAGVGCGAGMDEAAAAAQPTPADLHIERAMRFYPHLQDTGGFFVAVLRKVAPLPAACNVSDAAVEAAAAAPEPAAIRSAIPAAAVLNGVLADAEREAGAPLSADAAHALAMRLLRKRFAGWADLPLRALDANSAPLRALVRQLGLDILEESSTAKADGIGFFGRTDDDGALESAPRVYVASRGLTDLLNGCEAVPADLQQARLGLITAGLKTTSKGKGAMATSLGVSQEAMPVVEPWLVEGTPARLDVPADLVHAMLQSSAERAERAVVALRFTQIDELFPGQGLLDQLKRLPRGHVFLRVVSDEGAPDRLSSFAGRLFCGFVGSNSLTLHIRHQLVASLANLHSARSINPEVIAAVRAEAARYAAQRAAAAAGAARLPEEDDDATEAEPEQE